DSESSAQQDLEGLLENNECLLDVASDPDVIVDMSDPKSWHSTVLTHIVGPEDKGLYSLVFCRCAPPDPTTVSFRMRATFHNPGKKTGPDYLSAGETELPTVFFCFFCVFGTALVAWVAALRRRPAHVHSIHHMMGVLLLFKTLAMLFESIRYHYLKAREEGRGERGEGTSCAWSIVYYVFAFLKGIMLFVVILLIGTGWSLIKPYLNDREKRIVVVVLSLQVRA
ncbi:unnamed protein product, partial [Phaeothamnion confervicola]